MAVFCAQTVGIGAAKIDKAAMAKVEYKEGSKGGKGSGPKDDSQKMIWIKAKKPGTCKDCKGAIVIGQQILWLTGTKNAWCEECGNRKVAEHDGLC